MRDGLPKFERDSAYRRRGGSAKWILLQCGICGTDLGLYQKDGPGQLLRLYLDRIASTNGERPFAGLDQRDIRPLGCISCKTILGVPMTYQGDDRPRTALRLVDPGVRKVGVNNAKALGQLGEIDVMQTMATVVVGVGERS